MTSSQPQDDVIGDIVLRSLISEHRDGCRYDAGMHNPVDLPPGEAREVAPARVVIDPISGLPVITLGYRITSADVAEALRS